MKGRDPKGGELEYQCPENEQWAVRHIRRVRRERTSMIIEGKAYHNVAIRASKWVAG
jgi:hypothetical protein